jgi:tetratricopeptide (TPR) repeat protein
MTANRLRVLLLCGVLLAGYSGVWKLQQAIDRRLAATQLEEDQLVMRSGSLIKFMSLEYAPLVADIYWTRVVQYYGNKRVRHDPNVRLLWPLLDITTTLDPNLIPAYRFGSTFLAEAQPRGAGKPELAVQLLERGIRANPDSWRLYEDLGFVYYFSLRDYDKAAEAFAEGSKNPKALIWMKILAARVSEKGETPETSIFLWTEILHSSTDPQIKENALTHLRLLAAQADCDKLDDLATEYEKRTGRLPTNVNELVKAGLVPKVPSDPLGFAYVFDSDGMARLNPASPLFKDQQVYERPF